VEQLEGTIAEYLRKRRVPALVEVHIADDVLEGARSLVQSAGVGPLYPNTFLLGETERPENMPEFARLIRLVHQLRRNLVIVREAEDPPPPERRRTIDVWWGRERQNAGLMLALAYLLQASPEWRGARLHLKTLVDSEEEREHATAHLRELIEAGRLEAQAETLVRDRTDRFDDIREASRDADLVLLGLRPPDPEETDDDYSRYYAGLIARTDGFPPTAMVLAAEEIEFRRIFE
jgi:nucleotide-binding universal stress UspA family protein